MSVFFLNKPPVYMTLLVVVMLLFFVVVVVGLAKIHTKRKTINEEKGTKNEKSAFRST